MNDQPPVVEDDQVTTEAGVVTEDPAGDGDSTIATSCIEHDSSTLHVNNQQENAAISESRIDQPAAYQQNKAPRRSPNTVLIDMIDDIKCTAFWKKPSEVKSANSMQ